MLRNGFAVWLAMSGVVLADVKLAPPFTDHAVLQRDKPVAIWGTADPGEEIKVMFKGQSLTTSAGKDGKWKVELAALSASTDPADLVVAGKNMITLRDVVVGEVWFCSGQSNMAFTVKEANDAEAEIAAGNYPLIREFKVDRKVADTPIDMAQGQWECASPATVAKFSAVGYYFARQLYTDLKVPVGLINASWGGTYVESWLSPASLAQDSAGRTAGERWQKILAAYPEKKKEYATVLADWKANGEQGRTPKRPAGPGDKDTAGGLFNAMVHPFTAYSVRGILWYQGEANVPRSHQYAALFHSLITRWREAFGQGDLPFYWVQLPNFENTGADQTERAVLRDAQASALTLPSTGQAVTIDIGEARDNHPKNKQEVGRRLSLLAKAKVYNLPADYSGPVFREAVREGDALRLTFDHAEGGLISKTGPLGDFQVAGADGKFQPAVAEISGASVVVRASTVPAPVQVSYAWRNAPVASLFNAAGLPAAPFRATP